MFKRFTENDNLNKRNENNFFDAKIFTNIEKEEIQNDILNYIKKEIIEGDINDSKDEGEEKIND